MYTTINKKGCQLHVYMLFYEGMQYRAVVGEVDILYVGTTRATLA